MIKKIFLGIFLAAVILMLFFILLFYSLFRYDRQNKILLLKISEKNKPVMIEVAKMVKRFIYREATIHNPEGDVLPDELDDEIIKGIKNKVE